MIPEYSRTGRASNWIFIITNSRYVNAGLFYLRQLFFATYDIKVHTDKGTYLRKRQQPARSPVTHRTEHLF